MGSLLFQQGKEHIPAEQFGPGDIGAVAKLKEVQTGDRLLDREVATDAVVLCDVVATDTNNVTLT